METEYQKLLKRAVENLPKKESHKDRFVVPELVCEQQGNKTILKNFGDLLAVLRREPRHLSRYLFKELATRGSIKRNLLVLDTRLSKENLRNKIQSYVQEFVDCKVCGEPDTKLVQEGRYTMMVCEACGRKAPIRVL
jgi:translation initiation factor 2 subunit 2